MTDRSKKQRVATKSLSRPRYCVAALLSMANNPTLQTMSTQISGLQIARRHALSFSRDEDPLLGVALLTTEECMQVLSNALQHHTSLKNIK
jgi:hypothetical protein